MKHLFFLLPLLLQGCTTKPGLSPGNYLLSLQLDSAVLPVRLFYADRSPYIMVLNGQEIIRSESLLVKEDSISFRLPVFNSEFKGVVTSDSTFEGSWYNYAKEYQLPFKASKSPLYQYKNSNSTNITGKWKAIFSKGTTDEYPAVGIFGQTQNRLRGTFLTETGDYRFLEGEVHNNSFYLSAFDGSHAYLFTGTIANDSMIVNGRFYSGKSWSEPWYAKKDSIFELRNADSLTYLKPGYNKLTFSFPDLNKKPVSLDDQRFKNKVVIVQIMGSWCPNCLDESQFYAQLYNQYKNRGLEIIALAYEQRPDFEYARTRVEALKKKLNTDYTFLIAGTSKKEEAAKTLPMLNHIMSFPTSIYIDRKGNIVKIHTGFSGPGTGQYYEKYVTETTALVEKLLNER